MKYLSIFIIIFIAWLLSSNKKAISWPLIIKALILQLIFAFLLFRFTPVTDSISTFTTHITNILNLGSKGLGMVFGNLGEYKYGFIFFIAMFNIIFIYALANFLTYITVLPYISFSIGKVISKLLKTTPAESVITTSNAVLDFNNSPLMVRPILKYMSNSEYFVVMVSGIASIAGTTLAGYIALGVNPQLLVTACVTGIPGNLLIAKIFLPETSKSNSSNINIPSSKNRKVILGMQYEREHSSVLDALNDGATKGLQIALGISAMIIAFIGVFSFIEYIFNNIVSIFSPDLNLMYILGVLFRPITFLLDVHGHDAEVMGGIFAKKILLNEFVAYIDLSSVIKTLSSHTVFVTTILLCGFANISTIGMLLAGIKVLAPEKLDFAKKVGWKVLLAGIIANILNAAVANLMYTEKILS